jgi:hypothetical protein
MKYEIVKDTEDTYALIINGVLVTVTRDLDAIMGEITDDASNRKKNPKRTYTPAVIEETSSYKWDKPSSNATDNDKDFRLFHL